MGLSASDLLGGAVSSGAKNATGNSTHNETMRHICSDLDRNILSKVTVALCLVGLVGNGTVIWLLGFRVKRNSFSVYIFNLACADFTYLLVKIIWAMLCLLSWYWHLPVMLLLVHSINHSSFLVSMSLLVVLSTERCVSVLCPIWYRCHRPKHLSSILCTLIWVLGSCSILICFYCMSSGEFSRNRLVHVFFAMCVLTFLVLCVSSLTLFIRVQCRSRRRQPSRLYLTLLLSVLAFMLLGMPYGMLYHIYILLSKPRTGILFGITKCLLVLNSVVNPVIYFFVGRPRQSERWKSLPEVLQRALMEDEEAEEQCAKTTISSGAACASERGAAVLWDTSADRLSL